MSPELGNNRLPGVVVACKAEWRGDLKANNITIHVITNT